jgi:hypothetical protein
MRVYEAVVLSIFLVSCVFAQHVSLEEDVLAEGLDLTTLVDIFDCLCGAGHMPEKGACVPCLSTTYKAFNPPLRAPTAFCTPGIWECCRFFLSAVPHPATRHVHMVR